jgi:secondary thiamine-phosphate synthase enzyme
VPALPSHVAPTVKVALDTARRVELLDVTDRLDGVAAASGLADGTLHVWCPHTSCGLAVTEDEEGLHEDLAAVLDELAPADRRWAHDDLDRRWQNVVPGEAPNGDSHIRALLTTTVSLCVPIEAGALGIGRWQRIFVVELDGPRRRALTVQAWGTPTSVEPGVSHPIPRSDPTS